MTWKTGATIQNLIRPQHLAESHHLVPFGLLTSRSVSVRKHGPSIRPCRRGSVTQLRTVHPILGSSLFYATSAVVPGKSYDSGFGVKFHSQKGYSGHRANRFRVLNRQTGILAGMLHDGYVSLELI